MNGSYFAASMPLALGFLTGIMCGAAIVWLLIRGKADGIEARVKNEKQVELALLNERLSNSHDQLTRLANTNAELELSIKALRDELDSIRDERAKLQERASRVALLEAAQRADAEKIDGLQEFLKRESSRAATLSEQSSRLPELENAQKADRGKIDSLQNLLRQEASNVATLTEQASRVPELESMQRTAREKIDSLLELLKQEAGRVATLSEQTLSIPKLSESLENAEAMISQFNQQIADLRGKLGAAESTLANHEDAVTQLRIERDDLMRRRDGLTKELQESSIQVAELGSALESERKQSEEKLLLLNEAKEQLSNQFKALASDILEEKSKRFTEQNQTNLTSLLEPLKNKLTEFQGKVEEVYVNEGKDRAALGEQVKQLMSLNQQLSQDAHNLTRALKGQSKAQGNWGELILERVLETSGLTKGIHYLAQESHSRDDGTRAQPDVIIRLPEGRHLIVDAKVSLTAYDEYVNAETDLVREAATKRHIDSIRSHIKGLSSKNYQELYDIKSLDFVLMFIPVEPAFMLGIASDGEIWQDAWKQNVLLVSPSTLLFTVRTVAHLWRQEQQTRNAQDIAKRGAELYDKLVGFVEDLDAVGSRLQQAQKAYDGAYSKFTGGRGNVIRQAEMLKELGVKPSKVISPTLIELAFEDDPLPESASQPQPE